MPRRENYHKTGAAERRRAEKRDQAEERKAAYASLTNEEKLTKIAGKPGHSNRERSRIKKGDGK